ncbi:hypothetical protein ERO13_D11G112050v2 [Gossypium hirsutum]|uniref:Protein NIM1-INTERACTING 1 n=4 Tax=Gossypium TaxID=3633 RepID=A0A1U8K050_GOSHI|nr:protein NIM1-INTERACTING 1-like [Gossypium hirsutum]KAB2003233.1 hypothetical protein ES319_D11G117400v1 [Gossypium barbadense]KAG4119955.1 hypothetical protein ERO13_D11G112050v2 [Gossypium hirsutum]TYG44801.1 hypothetical protein ES288_D11G124000v1 [Gossypium darwinii]TYI55145.1 hypothetical protein E1A91_D11G120800v1 [Gossypium mustelinum]
MASEKENHVVNGEDEEEEEKMEQFFALLRNFREARNRRKHELIQREQEEISKKKKKKKNKISKLGDDGEKSSWVPSFEWEDFTAEIEFRRPSIIFPPSFNNKQGEKKHEDDGLDLNLTLSPASS